jgi:hypothetical protein
MSYHGDIRLGDTIDVKFTTRRFSTGAPHTLAGSPAVAAYVGNGTTEITAGITLTVDFDSRTGLNNVRVVASGGNGFATATNVQLVITAGTVDSVSVVGEVIGSFSIENRSALMPTTATRTLDVTAGGEAGIDLDNAAGTLGTSHFDASFLTASLLATDAVNEIRDAVTGGAYALSTDANGRIRIVDGTAAGELDTTSGGVLVSTLAAQAKADVNAEVVDVIRTDTIVEPGQGTPPATASLQTKLDWLYMAWRNKKTQTGGEQRLFADDTTTIVAKASLTDDGTTLTVGEFITGA